ncbi:MAG: stalk domain-containing protein [Bacillota bacterium]|nr:stalk domain-containing protein [Bacillota bacterium]
MINVKSISKVISILLLLSFIFTPLVGFEVEGATNIRLVVNGNDITHLSEPIIVKDRTLVPIRFVVEGIGGEVEWDGEERSVRATRGDSEVYLKIDSYLFSYNNGEEYGLSDVSPEINNLGNGDRTYVPLRLITNAFGIGIEWDGENRIVNINSSETSEVENFFHMDITSHSNGDIITGEEDISVDLPEELINSENELRLILIEKGENSGFIIKKSSTDNSTLNYIPKMSENGDKLLVAAVYKDEEFLAGDLVDININVNPEVSLKGVKEGETYSDSITLENTLNFFPKYVRYQFKNVESERTIMSGEQDPLGNYTWTPTFENNGTYEIKVIAYDEKDNSYESDGIKVNFDLERVLTLRGVSEGMEIDDAVNLIANRNFNVNETHYLIRDKGSQEERILKTIPYGGYLWFPGPEDAGKYDLKVRVEDTRGSLHDSPWVGVEVLGTPKLIFNGIGPNEVVTGEKKLNYKTNVELGDLKFILTDKENGSRRIIHEDFNDEEIPTYSPVGTDSGKMTVKAEGVYNGQVLSTEEIEFNVYLDDIYSAKPIVEKDKFMDFASKLAVESKENTGMSAALQTAQAILETGWGQYVPVDKYTGKFSYNLFGIKGEGTNGSIISNTWEVYNGVSYRVDDYFRAYNNEDEAWQDHKNILLNLERYKGFRDVMYDSTKGAWAVKRAGYATDPQYPIKLMDIIDMYDLNKLDEVEI